jgi:hypothetical protein
MGVQERAGELLHRWLREQENPDLVLQSLDAIYREALVGRGA